MRRQERSFWGQPKRQKNKTPKRQQVSSVNNKETLRSIGLLSQRSLTRALLCTLARDCQSRRNNKGKRKSERENTRGAGKQRERKKGGKAWEKKHKASDRMMTEKQQT